MLENGFYKVLQDSDKNEIFTEVNIANALKIKTEDVDELYLRVSGLKYIISEIEREFQKHNISDTFFIEFNLLGTLLDVDNKERLTSFVYVKDPSAIDKQENNFSDNIVKYSSSIIKRLFEKDYTLFHHPDLFFDPKSAHTIYSVCSGKEIDDKEVDKVTSSIVNYSSEYKMIEGKKRRAGSIMFFRNYKKVGKEAEKIRTRHEEGDEHYSLSEASLMLHRYYHQFIIPNPEGSKSIYMSIPILGSKSSNIMEWHADNGMINIQGQGACFIFFKLNDKVQNDTELKDKLDNIAKNLFISIGELARCFSYNYLFNVGLRLQQRATQEAIKAAKAAIMSRNMSHNLGSHVMYYLNLKLSTVGHILKADVLKDLLFYANNSSRDSSKLLKIIVDNGELIKVEHALDSIQDVSLPFLLGLGKFINYLQERMDFIATVSTDYIPYFLTTSFKDAIYDEFNYDLRVRRHKDDINEFKNKQVENIVLDYIARSEGLARNDISIQYRDIYENNTVSIFNGEKTPKQENDSSYAAYEALNDIHVDLPGGQTGRQAFFSILENIIRNAAKHGKRQTNDNKKLTITIGLENSEEHPDLYKCTVVDSFISGLEVSNKINEIIRNGYIKPNGEMDENGKGIKEILISASWLRGLDNVQQEDLQTVLQTDLTEDNHLCYTFYLLKPQKCALIISENLLNILHGDNEFNKKAIEKYGWNIYNENISEDEFNNLRHKIIVMDPSLEQKKIDIFRKLSSSRILVPKTETQPIQELISTIKKAVNSANIKQELENIYQQQYKKWLDDMKFNLKSILIYDSKVNSVPQTNFQHIEILKSNQIPSGQKPFILINKALKASEDLDKYSLLNYIQTKYPELKKILHIYPDLGEMLKNYPGSEQLVQKYPQLESVFQKYPSLNEDLQQYPKMNIVYKSHFIKADYDEPLFMDNFDYIESITGHNSTDRLIRHTKIDDLLFYQLNESAQTKVLLIDERFWSDYTGIDNDSIETFLNDCFTFDEIKPAEIINEFDNMILSGVNPQIKLDVLKYFNLQNFDKKEKDFVYNELKKYLSNRPISIESAKALNKIIRTRKTPIEKTLQSLPTIDFLKFRKTYIYNIVETIKGSIILPMNFSSEEFINGKVVCYKVNVQNDDICILPCIYNKDEKTLVDIKNYKLEKFHIMSIHQGILDKIYKRLNNNIDINKVKVTDAIKSFFIREKYINKPFIIHSGRSKPTQKDMPQQIPFIQFSSLKNALNDCKFTLTELLYGAKYKK